MKKSVLYFLMILVTVTLFLTTCASDEPAATVTQVESPTELPTERPTTTNTAAPLPTATTIPTQVATATNTPTPVTPTPVPESDDAREDFELSLQTSPVQAYPGPAHFVGDVLTFEIDSGQAYNNIDEFMVSITVADEPPIEVTGTWRFSQIRLREALDTGSLQPGSYTVTFQAEGSEIDWQEQYEFVLLPSDERPLQEANLAWEQQELSCCILHTISNTAASRDIAAIMELVDETASSPIADTNTSLTTKLNIYFIDRLWGNGGFGGNGELVLSYTDRFYGPGLDLGTIIRHELSHALGFGEPEEDIYFLFNEGLSVFLAGGHYKQEPLDKRGAAMLELGYSASLANPFDAQHEIAYLKGGALMTFIMDVYGEEVFWQFVESATVDPTAAALELREETIQAVFGTSFGDFDQAFQDWLEAIDPEEQVEDLALTIRVQNLRRQYQSQYSVSPQFIFGSAAESYGQPYALPSLVREARDPQHVAIELMLMNAQQAIVDGRYDNADQLADIIEDVLNTQSFDFEIARTYFSIVQLLAEMGYEVVSLNLGEAEASVTVTSSAPNLESLQLRLSDGVWELAGE
ncbi:MAG: hypothetical protein KC434_15775 [Anaerolineales bacterium]|nr:hypothetical protein [Anaerolineales bacterium]